MVAVKTRIVTVGLDLGQRRDPTALAVVEQDVRPRGGYSEETGDALGPMETHHLVRHLERLPLGTPYPDVARRVADVLAAIERRQLVTPQLYLDATGVGTPVVDMLRAAGVTRCTPVYFTHGDRRTRVGRELRLGKAWLVSRLQALLQGGRIHLPQTEEAQALAGELLDYEIKIDQSANDTYGAFRVGAHDDLVTALGLATQEDGGTSIEWF